jgi:pseudouridine synthase
MERLQKVLARAGVASRRAAERLIVEGRVRVNGEIVTRLGTSIDPEHDAVRVDGRRIRTESRGHHRYLVMNKPRGVMTTLSDPEGRPTIADLLPRQRARVFPVGRLDFQSEGLLLLTDDGELAEALMHPRNKVPKTYLAKVRGEPSTEALARLRRGVRLDGRPTLPARVALSKPGANAWVELTIVEGRKHQVRRMLDAVGHPVVKLRRIRYGSLALGDLAPGEVRSLTPRELAQLRARGPGRARRGRPRRS